MKCAKPWLMVPRKLATMGIVCSILVLSTAAGANSYNVTFYNGPGVIAGTGVFSFVDPVGDGTYHLDALGGFSINFTIGSSTFTDANIDPGLAPHVLVVVFQDSRNFYFDNDGVFGEHGGSLDFDKSDGTFLTTEPNYVGPPPLDLYMALDSNGHSYFGVYTAATEPSSLLLLGSGLLGVLGVVRRSFLS